MMRLEEHDEAIRTNADGDRTPEPEFTHPCCGGHNKFIHQSWCDNGKHHGYRSSK